MPKCGTIELIGAQLPGREIPSFNKAYVTWYKYIVKTIHYLGFHKPTKSFHFHGEHGGEGRFLKYVSYPFWNYLPEAILDPSVEVPSRVMESIQAFLLGVSYVPDTIPVPKSTRKSAKSAKPSTRKPEEDLGRNGGASGDAGRWVSPNGPTGSGLGLGELPLGCEEKPKRKRRTKLEMEAYRASLSPGSSL